MYIMWYPGRHAGLLSSPIKTWIHRSKFTVVETEDHVSLADFQEPSWDSSDRRARKHLVMNEAVASRDKACLPLHCERKLEVARVKQWTLKNMSGAESGWDFSSRWLSGRNLSSIQAEKVVPVDLNCVLLRMERLLSKYLSRFAASRSRAATFEDAAERRVKAMQRLLWSEELKTFRDFRLDIWKPSSVVSISDYAAPLWAGLPDSTQVPLMLEQLRRSGLLQEGGASTTTLHSGQQWDAPNAWAPLQLMLIEGLEDVSRFFAPAAMMAEDLAQKWLRNCFEAWQKHKAMFEKYDAFRVGEGGGGGEYVPQTGFGWSNGVAMVLLAKNGNRSLPFVPGLAMGPFCSFFNFRNPSFFH
eukprot:symbB.v1.2.022189.t1/scaffold1957.1/size97114/4